MNTYEVPSASSAPFDIVIEGETPLGNVSQAAATVRPLPKRARRVDRVVVDA
jgi:hypothetical protein